MALGLEAWQGTVIGLTERYHSNTSRHTPGAVNGRAWSWRLVTTLRTWVRCLTPRGWGRCHGGRMKCESTVLTSVMDMGCCGCLHRNCLRGCV